MARNISVGIDIGTYQVKVVVTERDPNDADNLPRIIATGFAESKGLRHGYIINSNDVMRSLKIALGQAEKTSGLKIRRAYLSIGGIGLMSTQAYGDVIISKADSEITRLDLDNALFNAEEDLPKTATQNKKIIHTIPISYKIDGKLVFGNPLGMHGEKLEVKALFVSCTEHHLDDIITAVEELGITVENVIASPLSAAIVATTKTQKIAGCVLANIGSETVSIVVFENNLPISLEVFPIGGTDITNDIALGLKIPLEEAEDLKIHHQATSEINYSRRKLEEIIIARLSDIFDLIDAHLKKIGRSGLLPAGIILTGGGSGIATIEELAKASLKLPSKIASLNFSDTQIKNGLVKDSSWLVAYGLCVAGSSRESDLNYLGLQTIKDGNNFTKKLWLLIKKILP